MKTLTLEQLSEKLKGKLWEKGDLKRIYLDRGYNTKKMSTKTYVEEVNGEFIVKCFVDCASQSWNWIENQQNDVIDQVEQEIKEIIDLLNVELIESRLSADETEVEVRISFKGIIEESFLTENQFDERFNKYPQFVFDNLPKTKEPIKKEPVNKPIIEVEKIIHQLGDGKKVMHPTFGLGEIIEESIDGDFSKVTILFQNGGKKNLLKRFANLTYLNE